MFKFPLKNAVVQVADKHTLIDRCKLIMVGCRSILVQGIGCLVLVVVLCGRRRIHVLQVMRNGLWSTTILGVGGRHFLIGSCLSTGCLTRTSQ
jgi:hypothetical protein